MKLQRCSMEFYEKLFDDSTSCNFQQILQDLNQFYVNQFEEEDISSLMESITIQELREAVFSLSSNSAPGIDGFHASFFQKNRELVKIDLLQMVLSFWNSETMSRDFNKTIITLIPKNDRPTSFKDIKPISLCNVVYKIIAKIMVIRLKSFFKNTQPLMKVLSLKEA